MCSKFGRGMKKLVKAFQGLLGEVIPSKSKPKDVLTPLRTFSDLLTEYQNNILSLYQIESPSDNQRLILTVYLCLFAVFLKY